MAKAPSSHAAYGASNAAFARYEEKPFYGSSHSVVTAIIRGLEVSPRSVLDVGVGSGVMASVCRAAGATGVDGLEIDPETRARVSSRYDTLAQTIEELREERRSNEASSELQYDLMLLLDVLEHLADPESFFDSLSRHIAPGGTVIVSLPNITHWTNRLMLLFGYFEYHRRGILDRTHLQFISPRRLEDMGQRAGLSVVHREGTIVPLELVVSPRIARSLLFSLFARLRKLGTVVAPALCSYQRVTVFKRM